MSGLSYWTQKQVSRRRLIRQTAAAGGALAALSLIGCSSGGSSGSSGAAKVATTRTDKLDPGQGKPGGKLLWQSYGDPGGGLELIKIRNVGVYNMASLTHDG